MAEPNLGDIVTTTLRNRSRQIRDNVSKGNVLLNRLAAKGGIREAGSGRTIVEELDYVENSTFMWYSGYEALDTTPSKVVDAAEYGWKQCAVAVTGSGLETRIQNAGDAAVLDLLESRMTNAERTMRNNMVVGLYSDGTGTGGKQITGLAAAVSTSSGATYGGINSTTFSFWDNKRLTGSVSDTVALDDLFRSLWLSCTRGPDHPQLIICGAGVFETYWDNLTAIQRITTDQSGGMGFKTLDFAGGLAEVAFEDSGVLNSSFAYFLNLDYIKFRPHTGTNMVPLDRRESINQDAFVNLLIWAGNLTVSNRSLQGVLSAN